MKPITTHLITLSSYKKKTNTNYTICGNNRNASVSATMTYQLCPMEIDDQSVSLSKGDFQNILTVELL